MIKQQTLYRRPIYFEKYVGSHDGVYYKCKAKSTEYFFMKDRIFTSMLLENDPDSGAESGIALSLKFIGSNDTKPQGIKERLTKINYIIGKDRSKWRRNLPTFDGVKYTGVWDGVDLEIEANKEGLKLYWKVSPHADPSKIQLEYMGANRLSVTETGELKIEHDLGESFDKAPVAYQIINGEKTEVPCEYRLDSDLARFSFALGEYDPNFELIIDPLMPYGSYLGGSEQDAGMCICVDEAGSAYVAGYTISEDFPIIPGAYQIAPEQTDWDSGFVSKFTPDGSDLIFSTYLSADRSVIIYAIDIDDDLCVYVTGDTNSLDFPTTDNAFRPDITGNEDGFLTKFAADGSDLVYSTYLGSFRCFPRALKVSPDGFAYVGGFATTDYPTTPGAYQNWVATNYSGFVTKFSQDGSAQVFSTLFSGSNYTRIQGIAVDDSGCVFAAGYTQDVNLPTTDGAFERELQGSQCAFAVKFNDDGTNIICSTYFGGSNLTWANGICADAEGNAYLTGTVFTGGLPVTPNAPQPVPLNDRCGFAAKLNADFSDLIYSTYLTCMGTVDGMDIKLLSGNRACVACWGDEEADTFPSTPMITPVDNGRSIIVILTDDGSDFYASQTIAPNIGVSLAIGNDSSIYITGWTNAEQFIPTAGAFQTEYGGGPNDAYVMRVKYIDVANSSVWIKRIG